MKTNKRQEIYFDGEKYVFSINKNEIGVLSETDDGVIYVNFDRLSLGVVTSKFIPSFEGFEVINYKGPFEHFHKVVNFVLGNAEEE